MDLKGFYWLESIVLILRVDNFKFNVEYVLAVFC